MLRSRTRRKMYAEKSPLFDHVKADIERLVLKRIKCDMMMVWIGTGWSVIVDVHDRNQKSTDR